MRKRQRPPRGDGREQLLRKFLDGPVGTKRGRKKVGDGIFSSHKGITRLMRLPSRWRICQARKALGQHFQDFFARHFSQRASQRGAIQAGGSAQVAGLLVAGRRADAMHRRLQAVPLGVEERSDPLFIRRGGRPQRLRRFRQACGSISVGRGAASRRSSADHRGTDDCRHRRRGNAHLHLRQFAA